MTDTPESTDAESRLSTIVESALDGIVSIDERGTVLSFNPAACRIFGYDESEVIGQNVKVLMAQPYRGEHDGYIDRYLTTGEAKIIGIGREVERRRKDGSLFPLGLAVSESSAGSSRMFVGILRDHSEQRTSTPSLTGGRYVMRKFPGEGGQKRVFLAHDSLLDREVAFAVIRTEGLDDTGRARLQREAQAMGRLGDHPHIVAVLDLGESTVDGISQPYIVSQYMAGGSVEDLLKGGEPLPLQRTLDIAIGVCRGLEAAHRVGFVHRDLKPGNIWLAEDGTAQIGDFGTVMALDRTRLTADGGMFPVGTVGYMPPEQAVGGEVTPQSDLYSLGVMLYEMVTGRLPWQLSDPAEVGRRYVSSRGAHEIDINESRPAHVRLSSTGRSKRPRRMAEPLIRRLNSLSGYFLRALSAA